MEFTPVETRVEDCDLRTFEMKLEKNKRQNLVIRCLLDNLEAVVGTIKNSINVILCAIWVDYNENPFSVVMLGF